MVPRVGRQGKSFKGAALYYLHDKGASTAERVEYTETRNLPTDDPDLGWRVMAATAKDSDRLKRDAGVDRRGRKLTKPVFHLSTSWHPEQKPERAHMVSTMDSALAALGLERHQAVYVIHNDEPHPHIHAFVNLVNQDNGRSNSVRYSKKRLSLWAEAYEREHGIYCDKRIENNAKRAQQKEKTPNKKTSRRKEKAIDLKAEITRRYNEADSGKAFRASLAELGYTLAQGKRVVLVDKHGNTYALNRQLEGVRAADVRKKLKGLELPPIETPPNRSDSDGRSARGKRGDKAVKRAEHITRSDPETSRRPPPFSRKHAREPIIDRERDGQRQHARDGEAGIKHQKETVRTGLLNRLQDAHHAQWGRFFEEGHQQRHRLGLALDAQYGAHERKLRAAIAARERKMAHASAPGRWYSAHVSRERQALENDRLTLASIEQRRTEARDALERSLENRRSELEQRQAEERENVPHDFTPRGLDPLARSIEQQQAAANAAYLGAAGPSESQSAAGQSPEGEPSASADAEREAFMERMNGEIGLTIDHGGH